MNPNIRLIAADYDGTLRYEDTMTEEDIAAIHKWKQKGNLFVIDTGRSMESILTEAGKYQLPVDYFITNNGGMVFDKDQKELFSSCIDPVMSVDIMYIANQIGSVVSYVVNDGYHRHRIIVNPTLTERRYPSLQPDMDEEELMKLGKYAQFVISMETEKNASDLAERINAHFADSVVAYANRFVTDIVPKGISKASGLSFLCKHIGIDPDNVYTIGDADNDIPLMEFGSHGTCMAFADAITRSHARQTVSCIAEMIQNIIE